jgi:threonine aldolase
LREFFECDCQVYFVFDGTAANSLAVASLCRSYHSIICHELAHLEADECGVAEFFSNGTKILLSPGKLGKVDPQAVTHLVLLRSDIHYPKPRVLSLTQPTEVGSVYSIEELQALAEVARQHGLRVHMDGARFANALASLRCTPKEITWQVGVDALSLGGTKAGMPAGEAVVFFQEELAQEFDYRCKQAGQLASKVRFLAAPWITMLETGAYLHHAAHANRCAQLLADRLQRIAGVELAYPCQANAVFAQMPETMITGLHQAGWEFYAFIGSGHARFMCSWATTQEDIEELTTDLLALTRGR